MQGHLSKYLRTSQGILHLVADRDVTPQSQQKGFAIAQGNREFRDFDILRDAIRIRNLPAKFNSPTRLHDITIQP